MNEARAGFLSCAVAFAWAVGALPIAAGDAGPGSVPVAFRDAAALRVRPNSVERPDDEMFAWGRQRLVELEVAGDSPAETAARIAVYIHDNFAFTPDRPPRLADFVQTGAGNCYAHARLGAFLLRLADVPARFMYEVHLEQKTPDATASARERGIGLFGQYHNDHFWLLYYDGQRWVPFDSTLGIASYSDFIRVKIESPQGGVANPPFLLWQEAAEPGAPMENVTAAFWSEVGRDTLPGVPVADWRALLDDVGRLSVDDLLHPLSDVHEEEIARVGRAFFGAGSEAD